MALEVCAAKYTKVLKIVMPNTEIIIIFIHKPFTKLIFFIKLPIQNGVNTKKVTNHL